MDKPDRQKLAWVTIIVNLVLTAAVIWVGVHFFKKWW